jgi:EAL domain-containing protein (putative c-di-GMP-specific phosphodiesterase class I)
MDVSTGRISACEALVRWTHPTRGPVPPNDFIPLAEETGLIIAIGEHVLRTACKEAASWTKDILVAVNLSSVQFRAGDLPSMVASILNETGLEAKRLELEITESILIEDKEHALEMLKAIRGLGVRIALDDFGTGYSSLSYLSSFPFDKIKIDRSFIRDVPDRPDSAAIVRAILTLAETLEMSTTAEGVERVEELDWLREHGCDQAQGFLFSRAVPARDLALLLGMNGAKPSGEPKSPGKAA